MPAVKDLLSQNVDEGAADVVGVTFPIAGDAVGNRILNRPCGIDRGHRTGARCILHVSRSQRIAAAGGERGDSDGVVGGDADIHARNGDPLWRVCKQQIFVVMK